MKLTDSPDINSNKKLRVLFMTRKWPPAVGGMEVYSVELTQELSQSVDLVTHKLPGRKNGQPPPLFSLGHFFVKEAVYLLRHRNQFDVIHFGDLVLFPLAWLSHKLGRSCHHVISAHGTDIAYGIRDGWKPRLYRLFLSWVSKNSEVIDVVIANSNATEKMCRKIGLEKLTVINLGVRLSSEPPEDQPHENYVLFVGRVARRKGVAWFVREVLPGLPASLTLKVAGTIWDPQEVESINEPRVEFLGPVFGDELLRLRRRALVVVMPNIPLDGQDFEGFGLTALEAGADGAVLLASSLDGIVDAVEDGVTGILVEPENHAAWVAEIERVANWGKDQRRAFLLKARQRIGEHYNWHRVMVETLAAYQADSDIPGEAGFSG